MGNWNINIQGIGAHHNADYPKDANKMAAAFVAELRRAGHTIEGATFTHGGKEDLRLNEPVTAGDVAALRDASGASAK